MLAGLNVAPKRQGVNGDIEENNLLSNMEWRRALGFFLQVLFLTLDQMILKL